MKNFREFLQEENKATDPVVDVEWVKRNKADIVDGMSIYFEGGDDGIDVALLVDRKEKNFDQFISVFGDTDSITEEDLLNLIAHTTLQWAKKYHYGSEIVFSAKKTHQLQMEKTKRIFEPMASRFGFNIEVSVGEGPNAVMTFSPSE